MGAKKFSHTHRSTMCGLKKLASGVFPESSKVLAERRRRKRTKNNKSPGYPGWLNEADNSLGPSDTSASLIIGSDNGLLPARCQAIIWTNAEILLIGPFGINFSEILIKFMHFHSRKCILKCYQERGGHFVWVWMCQRWMARPACSEDDKNTIPLKATILGDKSQQRDVQKVAQPSLGWNPIEDKQG